MVRRFLKSDWAPVWIVLAVVLVVLFLFAYYVNAVILFWMFCLGAAVVIGTILLFLKLFAPPVTSRPAGEPEPELSSEPAVESWSFEPDSTPEPETYGPITNLPNSFN